MERQEDDYTLTPSGHLGGKTSVAQGGKFLGEFTETEQALEFIKEHMEQEQYEPNVFWVSDHGNEWPINLDGEEIHFEDDGQPTMYEEYQDLYGGDDWDHGQYDEAF